MSSDRAFGRWRPISGKANRRLVVLVTAFSALAAAIIYDYGVNRDSDRRPSGAASRQSRATPSGPATDVSRWQSLIRAKDAINSAYQQAAVPYAEMAADLWTLALEPGDPRQIVSAALADNLPPEVEITELLVGESTRQADGVFTLGAQVKLTTGDARSAFAVLRGLAEPSHGLTWDSFTVTADPQERRIDLHGALNVVVVQAPE